MKKPSSSRRKTYGSDFKTNLQAGNINQHYGFVIVTIMKDDTKFRVTVILSTLFVASILSYNILQEYFMTEVGSYLKRRIYYEKVISKKGLPLHDAKYWRKIEE
jgi:hypothetical protein